MPRGPGQRDVFDPNASKRATRTRDERKRYAISTMTRTNQAECVVVLNPVSGDAEHADTVRDHAAISGYVVKETAEAGDAVALAGLQIGPPIPVHVSDRFANAVCVQRRLCGVDSVRSVPR